ncbi:glutathione S-transferase N-terminal domain-containing protein [Alcaligenaceae bacterium CGII-47]|nr:glutathione S-transferase N-terminal domain-containing protein [Alcaligenaceae bacterium CGII-47]
MKLYYFPGACPLATHIVLEWIGKPYETQRLTREQTKEPEYLALNPLGAVPTLVDGDFVLTQSAAILEYIAELSPEIDLIGNTPRERAQTRRWLGLCNADLHRTFALIFGADAYTDDPDFKQILINKTKDRLQVVFAEANRQLADKAWLTGKRSIADAYLYVLLVWARATELDLSAQKNLMSFAARMDADPGVQAAMRSQGLIN